MYYLHEPNGIQTGPFDFKQVQALAVGNKVSKEALYWYSGMAAWEPLSSLNLVAPAPPPLTKIRRDETRYLDGEELEAYRAGYFQRRFYQAFAALFIVGTPLGIVAGISDSTKTAFGLVVLVALGYICYCFLRYQVALVGWWRAVLVTALCFIFPPLIFLRLIMSGVTASRKYKEFGIQTDWLGVKPSELKHLKS